MARVGRLGGGFGQVKFEILVSDEGQIPMELVTIPAAGTNVEMTINVRRPIEDDIFNALLWHYADHAADLTVVDGELKQGGTVLAKNDRLAIAGDSIIYVYDKMGCDVLHGGKLDYAREATRWPLSTFEEDWVEIEGQWFQPTYSQYGILRVDGE